MTINRELLRLIARQRPAIWDLLGPVALNPQPLPPRDWAALNPQPIPPGRFEALNPQPIPPGAYGVWIGHRILELAWVADKLGTPLRPIADWEDDPCPTPFRVPPLPPHVPPIPEPEPGPDWQREYVVALAATLASATGPVAEQDFVRDALEHASRALEMALEH